VGSSWSSYWSRDSVASGAGGPSEIWSGGDDSRRATGAGGRLELDRVVANTSCFSVLLSEVFGLVDLMPDLDAVMWPSAVAGLWGWFWLRIFAVRAG
jgi:hypothetical protein